MTKETRIYNWEKLTSSVVMLGRLDSYMQKKETGQLSYTICKNKSQSVKDLNLFDISLSNIFWTSLLRHKQQKEK